MNLTASKTQCRNSGAFSSSSRAVEAVICNPSETQASLSLSASKRPVRVISLMARRAATLEPRVARPRRRHRPNAEARGNGLKSAHGWAGLEQL